MTDDSCPTAANPAGSRAPRWLAAVLVLVILAGLAQRVAIVTMSSRDLLRASPVTEDAYYAFTVARNLGSGRGMTADGVHATNGFQPLSTFLASLGFRMRPGDPSFGIRAYLVVSLLVSAAIALQVGLLASELTRSRLAILVGAAVYLFSPVFVMHDMNGLETGLTTCLLLLALRPFMRLQRAGDSRTGIRRAASLGLILGLLTLARIDNVMSVALFFAVHVIARHERGRRLREAITFSAIAAAILFPWLVANIVVFGSPLPMSGHSSMTPITPSERGIFPQGPSIPANTIVAVRTLFDSPLLYPLTPIIRRLPEQFAIHLLIGLAVCLLAAFAVRARARQSTFDCGVRRILWFSFAHLFLFSAVYITRFGSAHWFMHRYLFPSLVVTIPATLWMAWPRAAAFAPKWVNLLRWAWCAIWLLYLAYANFRRYELPNNEAYYDFAQRLASTYPGKRIAMFQSGTSGYFVPSVTNLDGKVNLAVHPYFATGRLADYVAANDFDVIADWPRLVDPLMSDPALAGRYERSVTGDWCIYSRRR